MKDSRIISNFNADFRTVPLISGNLRPFHVDFDESVDTDSQTVLKKSESALTWSKEKWCEELDDEKAIGFNLLWLSNIEAALEANEPDRLGNLLTLCEERDIEVILSVGSTPRWYEIQNINEELSKVSEWVRLIHERYANRSAFFAWYIPYEIYFAQGEFNTYIERLYSAIVTLCKELMPSKPVVLSPFFVLDKDKIFGDYYYASPDEYGRYWAHLIKLSGLDVIMLQDSGEHFSYVTNKQRRPFFEAMSGACEKNGVKFWANVETAEYVCPSIEEYVARYGKVHHATVKDIPWRPVPMERLKEKLFFAAEFAERIVTWGYYQFGRPCLGKDAKQWYENYERYYKDICNRMRIK
jgi:hypothetical protein